MSIEKRRDILQNAISGYIELGYELMNQTDTSAQLKKPKKFSWLMFLLTIWIAVGIIYVVYYVAFKKDEVVYMQVDSSGKLTVMKS